jgi:ABC-type taurine transport system ATPase subunit
MTSPLASHRTGTVPLADRRRRALVVGAGAGGALAALALPRIGRAQSAAKIRIGFWPVAAGGQQQTASIMRALAPGPEVLFLDEPFSALDFEMTLFIREKLQEVFMQTATTMLLVSHDLEEAVYLADQVLLLTKRPTRVAEILPYTDARPRTVATLSEPSFVAAKKKSLEIFQREVRR